MKVNRKYLFMKRKEKVKSSPANKVKYVCVCVYICMSMKTYDVPYA